MQAQALNLNQLIALFLAEAIRSKRTSLSRAAEISHRVVSKINLLKSEEQALSVLTEMEKDFDEISTLKHALHFGYRTSDIKVYESEIRDYASRIFAKDMDLSNAFLQDAAGEQTTIQELCLKYPEFCEFLMHFSEKAHLLPQMQGN